MSESQSRRDEDPIQATPDEKRAAFEWLRSLALDDSLSDTEQRYAAVALQAWHLISQEATELRKLNASLASETEYICKCGLRVVPHRCKEGTEF